MDAAVSTEAVLSVLRIWVIEMRWLGRETGIEIRLYGLGENASWRAQARMFRLAAGLVGLEFGVSALGREIARSFN